MIEGARVLLCDDSRIALMKLKKVFAGLGVEVVGAHQSGPEVIEAYKASADQVDLVSLDNIMPGMTGIEVLEELKQFDPEVKVLILSSTAQPELEQQAAALGAVGVLAKPYDPDRIRAVMEQALGGGS